MFINMGWRYEKFERSFFACESLIDYTIKQNLLHIASNVLLELEKSILDLKKKINDESINKKITETQHIADEKTKLLEYFLILKKLFKLARNDNVFQNSFGQIVGQLSSSLIRIFDVTDDEKLQIIKIETDGIGSLYVQDLENDDLEERISNAKEIITEKSDITIYYELPWVKPTINYKYESEKGFSRIDLLKLIYKGYRKIYDTYELEIDGENVGIGGLLFKEIVIEKILYYPNSSKIYIKVRLK